MAVTATPIFTQTPNVGALNAIVSTAMTNTKAYDGTETVGTPLALCYTAGANGSRIDQVQIKFSSTNGATASGTSTATVVRSTRLLCPLAGSISPPLIGSMAG